MIRHSLTKLKTPLIVDQIDSETEVIDQYSNYQQLANTLDISEKVMKPALKAAAEFWQRYRKLLGQGYLIDNFANIKTITGLEQKIAEAELEISEPQNNFVKAPAGEELIEIAVIGYVYNVFDQYLNMSIINKLKEMGVKVYTFSMVAENIIAEELAELRKPMFWQFSNKLYGAAEYYLKNEKIDGLIHLTAFGCGPDSILGQILEIDAQKNNKSFMTLRIDEQTGESHLITRIEAFIDLLRLKKESN